LIFETGTNLFAVATASTASSVDNIPLATTVIAVPIPANHPIHHHHHHHHHQQQHQQQQQQQSVKTTTGTYRRRSLVVQKTNETILEESDSPFSNLIQRLQSNLGFSPSLTLRSILEEMNEYVSESLASTAGTTGVSFDEQRIFIQALVALRSQESIWTEQVEEDAHELLSIMQFPKDIDQALLQALANNSNRNTKKSSKSSSSRNQRRNKRKSISEIILESSTRNNSNRNNTTTTTASRSLTLSSNPNKRNSSKLRNASNGIPPQVGERVTACLTRLNWTKWFEGTLKIEKLKKLRSQCFDTTFTILVVIIVVVIFFT